MKKLAMLISLTCAYVVSCGDNIVPAGPQTQDTSGGAGAGECFDNCPDANPGTGGGSGTVDAGTGGGSGSDTLDAGNGNGGGSGSGTFDAGNGDGSGAGSDGGSGTTCTDGQILVDGVCVDDGSSGTCHNPHKTLLCHVPPGNPDNRHSICVGNPAVDAHMAHGDSLGACP